MKPFYVELLRDEAGQEIPLNEKGERPVGLAVNEHLLPITSFDEQGNPRTTLVSRISVLWLDVNLRSMASPSYHDPSQLRWLELLSESESDGDEYDDEEDDAEEEETEDADQEPESLPDSPA